MGRLNRRLSRATWRLQGEIVYEKCEAKRRCTGEQIVCDLIALDPRLLKKSRRKPRLGEPEGRYEAHAPMQTPIWSAA